MPGMGLALLFPLLFLSLTIFFRSLLLRSLPSSFSLLLSFPTETPGLRESHIRSLTRPTPIPS